MNNVTEKALSTDHTGYFYVMNCSLQELKSVTVTHSTDYPHEMRHITADYSKMKNMSTSKKGYPFPYGTGFLSQFDYWTLYSNIKLMTIFFVTLLTMMMDSYIWLFFLIYQFILCFLIQPDV